MAIEKRVGIIHQVEIFAQERRKYAAQHVFLWFDSLFVRSEKCRGCAHKCKFAWIINFFALCVYVCVCVCACGNPVYLVCPAGVAIGSLLPCCCYCCLAQEFPVGMGILEWSDGRSRGCCCCCC